jgi:poly(3-hydroxybutyrate) depolymerase
LFYASHWYGGTDTSVVNGAVTNGGTVWAFYGLKHIADSVGEQAIFIAPAMKTGSSTWDLSGDSDDHDLFDDLLDYAKTNLCVDTNRVFAAGFSYGAMMTYSLSLTHQSQLRAVATLEAANWVGTTSSYWIPYPTDTEQKIAYLGITGMSDGTCPFIFKESESLGGIYCAFTHATDNGCTVPSSPSSVTATYAGSLTHVVYDFSGCEEGYPVRYITFDGEHISAPTDGQTADDGKKTWAPKAMWEFFTQF